MQTVASFTEPVEAHLLRTRLEAAGIEAFIRDENLVSLVWLHPGVGGGVKVDVADEDFERALAVLDES
ncbi:MAG TPA: DUF2007 domain-containing protein [Opitutaceae bacterium]|nr:DUF2007 domain-containing protein [Opitutaceae bacterium]HND61553.1 DUF2007 domain-containing protein [Opitutaceae bacterium]